MQREETHRRCILTKQFVLSCFSLLQGTGSALSGPMLSIVESVTAKPPSDELIGRTWVMFVE